MSKATDIPTAINLTVGSVETHAVDLATFLGDGQTVSSVTCTEEGTTSLTIASVAALSGTFTSRLGNTIASGKGCKAKFTAPSSVASPLYILWAVTLSGGDVPVFRQQVTVD